MERRDFLRLSALGILGLATGCSPRFDEFEGIGEGWFVKRVSENEFIVDGMTSEANLKANREGAIKGLQAIQNFGCKIVKTDMNMGPRSEIKIEVENPSCVINNFPHPVRTEVK